METSDKSAAIVGDHVLASEPWPWRSSTVPRDGPEGVRDSACSFTAGHDVKSSGGGPGGHHKPDHNSPSDFSPPPPCAPPFLLSHPKPTHTNALFSSFTSLSPLDMMTNRVVCGLTLCLALTAMTSVSAQPALKFEFDLSVKPTVWFNITEGLHVKDTPDQALTAFRDASGQVMAYASDNGFGEFFVSTGPSLFDITRDCSAPVLRGTEPWNRASVFPHSVWLVGTWTDDGQTVHGLVHDEYHPNTTDKTLCPSGDHTTCWYTTILAAKSIDGGRSFSYVRTPDNPRAIALATPQGYLPGGLPGPQGMPLHRLVHHPQDPKTVYLRAACQFLHAPSGSCVWRTQNISDVSAWRGWNGTDWSVRAVDPYTVPPPPADTPTAAALGDHAPGGGGMTFYEPAGLYVSMGSHLTAADPRPIVHIFYQTSTNMTTWSPVRVAGSFPLPEPFDGAAIYPHLMDPKSPSRNFDIIGNGSTPMLTFVTGMPKDGDAAYPRAGIAIPVKISLAA